VRTPFHKVSAIRDGMGGAPNHRYTASLATVATMHAQGWKSEGNGPGPHRPPAKAG